MGTSAMTGAFRGALEALESLQGRTLINSYEFSFVQQASRVLEGTVWLEDIVFK